jgi:hypothetical protein
MNFRKGERGQVVILLAFCMTVLLGFTGLAIDVGMLFRAKRNLQIAADAGAVAGARTLLYSGSNSSAQSAGAAAAQTNHYGSGTSGTAAGDGSLATINIPPASGPITSGRYVEAIVSFPHPTFFMNVLGFTSVTVQARAVAGLTAYGTDCIWLGATAGTGLWMKGSATINAPNCGIYVNSPSSNALYAQDNGDYVDSAYLDVVGNAQNDAFHSGSTPPTYKSAPRPNPYPNYNSPSTCDQTVTAATVTSFTLNAGASTVCFSNAGGVTIGSGTALTFPGATNGVTYVFQHGVNVAGNVTFGSGTCSGSGVNTVCTGTTNGATIDVDQGQFTQGNNILNVYAPTAGTYNGTALLVPPTNTYYALGTISGSSYSCDLSGYTSNQLKNLSNTLVLQWGSSGQVFDGIINAPLAAAYINDSGGGVVASGLDACTLIFNSGGGTNGGLTVPSYDIANKGTTNNLNIVLME